MKELPIALQIFSIREEAEKDFIKTMQQVKQMGYDGVELAGLYGYSGEQVRDILKEIGLIPISAHVSYQEWMEDIAQTAHRYAMIGCKYVVIPYLNEEDRYGTDSFKKIMIDIPVIAEACHKEGMQLLYHNHDFEFLKTPEGEYILDYMYRTFPKEILELELDTCWTKVAGENPTDYMKKYVGRLPIVHLKDYDGSVPPKFRAVGHGVQDMPSILAQAIAGGSQWVVVEQDTHPEFSAMEDARLSIEYLKSGRKV
jgi:sugar phosphate isomerase/epimerase